MFAVVVRLIHCLRAFVVHCLLFLDWCVLVLVACSFLVVVCGLMLLFVIVCGFVVMLMMCVCSLSFFSFFLSCFLVVV